MQETIQIVDYTPKYQQAFKSLNEAWIRRYFEMEAEDYKTLDYPQENIIDKGGYIAVALLNETPVGTCALIKMNNGLFDYELAKMGVAPEAQGRGIGYLLGQAIVRKAKALGAKNIYIESNTRLQPAIQLYRKLGFTVIEGIQTPYVRCDIQMELKL